MGTNEADTKYYGKLFLRVDNSLIRKGHPVEFGGWV